MMTKQYFEWTTVFAETCQVVAGLDVSNKAETVHS